MLEGRNAIVTGAGNGLGLSIARRFVEMGARILMVDKEAVVQSRVGEGQIPANSAFTLVKDLAQPDAAQVVFAAALAKLGKVDVVINNAAWSFHKPMTEVNNEEFDRVVAINQKTPFFLAQEFLRYVSRTNPRPVDPVIVNIGSVNALSGNQNLVAYAGTKGAIVSMTRAMAVEMQAVGIRANSISPGAVRTWVTENLIQSGGIVPEEIFQDLLIKRFASCEEVAELVAYLCGKKGAYVNGVNWVIDGGYMAH